ncbi:hypothetical protein COCCADRAFT_29759 [Bipolaris zeicola 26-R-13]|uniref:Uncharacterized protein n=1 Tax=Cochliobolus carbonum (strain 26-R-13) TaxID=930089 RepID=W6Y212_COCC2|nr:uncharacterized protein COCCADRAFT_29759 [Bipolaris zeicola 26-R-13]EUC29124.1 hypothetical protein COCCADRAFT_29759 [Bipolaris zeicola 26-R-13]
MDRGSMEPLAYDNRAPSTGRQGTIPGGQKEVSGYLMNMVNNKTWPQWIQCGMGGLEEECLGCPVQADSSKRRSANGWCCSVFGDVQHGNNRTTQPWCTWQTGQRGQCQAAPCKGRAEN